MKHIRENAPYAGTVSGRYSITPPDAFSDSWRVWDNVSLITLSEHASKRGAENAVERYQDADRRRAMPQPHRASA